MVLDSSLYSIQIERSFISGIIKYPEVLLEINLITEKEFYEHTHRVIFSIIQNLIITNQKINSIIIAQKLKDLGISMHGIDPFSYLDDLNYSTPNKNGILEIGKELIKLRIKRDLYLNAVKVQKYILESGGNNITEVINSVDKIYNSQINAYTNEDVPCDLFEEAETIINGRVGNTDSKFRIETPFNIFNDMFGPLRVGLTAICGRAKNNKSTILLNMGWGGILKNPELHCLYLDTELKKDDHIFRSLGALSQINPNYLEDGTWSRNSELVGKLKGGFEKSKVLKGKLHHHYIGNKPIEEIISIIRRWKFNTCGRDNPGFIILDYIKIGDEKLSNFNGEHQELGRKINALNALSQELNLPVLSSMQLNRSAVTDNKEDESAISMTDRLSWFANGVYIFRKKRPDELTEETLAFGTHKLIPVVLRYQGKNTSLLDLVRVDNGSTNRPVYKQNFINYNFSNFLLEERGTLRDIVMQRNLQANLQGDNHKNHNDTNF